MQRNLKALAVGASACLGLFVATTAANADGYERRGSIKDHAPRCASFNGFYLGGNVGWGYFDHTWSDRDAWAKNEFDANLPSSVSGTDNGWLGGVQGGYNFQRGCTLFGFEADWSWANLGKSQLISDGDLGVARDTLTVRSEINSFGTLRTRTGVVVDNLLLYATGGLAWAHVKSSWTAVNTLVATETFGTSDTRWGWVAGVGTEWAIAPNISIKSEALYLKFDDNESTFNSVVALANGNNPVKRFDEQEAIWVARIGVNYRFGCGSVC